MCGLTSVFHCPAWSGISLSCVCFFLLPAVLGKAEGVHRGQVAGLEHAAQQSMTCSAYFLQLDLSILINDALVRAVTACINEVVLSKLPIWQHVQVCLGSPTPVLCEGGSRLCRSGLQGGTSLSARAGQRCALVLAAVRQQCKAHAPHSFQSIPFPGVRGEEPQPDFV